MTPAIVATAIAGFLFLEKIFFHQKSCCSRNKQVYYNLLNIHKRYFNNWYVINDTI